MLYFLILARTQTALYTFPLFVCVCVCVCVWVGGWVCMYACVRECVHACVYMYTFACGCARTCVCVDDLMVTFVTTIKSRSQKCAVQYVRKC